MLAAARVRAGGIQLALTRGFRAGGALTRLAQEEKLITVSVNDVELEVPAGATVLHACEEAGVDIPRFCYHDRLSIAGNCRMCLVEVEKSPKPVASCAMPLMPGMKIKTDTPLVHKAREGVMEFLLSNHPLDCPICDQGGECDLQDQSMAFGGDKSRFYEPKRSVEDKDIGPLVKTIMTRCIHCTRCVRFAAEVAGVPILGTTGRGNGMEIGTYVSGVMFDSELSGNVVDLCPVGALTSKPYEMQARPWELMHTDSIDVTDGIGAAIRVDSRNNEVMRIVPRLNEEVNEEWISDKARFSYDGLKRQRLDTPMVRDSSGKLVAVSWKEALLAIKAAAGKVKPSEMLALAGNMADAESMVCLKDMMSRLGSNNTECRVDGALLDPSLRSNYTFNSTIQGVEDADVLVLVGSNPRMESPLLNARVRKCVLHSGLKVASVGPSADLTYYVESLGETSSALSELVSGKHAFCKTLSEAQRPMVVFGVGAFLSQDAGVLYDTMGQLAKAYPALAQAETESEPAWNGLNVLQYTAGRTAGLDVGFVPGPGSESAPPASFVYLLNYDGADPATLPSVKVGEKAFTVYQGHHGDDLAAKADVILPGQAYTEKEATYVNTEGRPQRTSKAVDSMPNAREDWKIVRAVSEVLGAALPYDSRGQVRARLNEVAPHMSVLGEVEETTFTWKKAGNGIKANQPFQKVIGNFYMTDPISRSSRTMARCTERLAKSSNSYA